MLTRFFVLEVETRISEIGSKLKSVYTSYLPSKSKI